MKPIYALLLLGLLGCGPGIESITIDPAHQACETREDCTGINTRCDGCDCGTPINREYLAYYNEMKEDCREPMNQCDLMCEKQILECIDGMCTFV